MSHYIHHVPGRLRVRCRSFGANPLKLEAIARKMDEMPGVNEVSINCRAGSVTILYRSQEIGKAELLTALDKKGCAAQKIKSEPRQGLSAGYIGETVTKTVIGTIVGTLVKSTVEPRVLTLLRAARVAR